MRVLSRWMIFIFFALAPAQSLSAQEDAPAAPAEPPSNFLFRDQFYLSPAQKIRSRAVQIDDFLIVERVVPEWSSNVSIVTGFAPQALRTQALKDVQTVDQVREWTKKEKKTLTFQGVPIQRLPVSLPDGETKDFFWVGNRGFDSYDEAAAEIAMTETLVEMQGGSFQRALELAQEFVEPEPPPAGEAPKTAAQYQKEEEIALKWLDQLDVGESLWGPFHGVPAGEPILYQSFGETTWRSTNLAQRSYRSQVAYWTNRIVLKGIRFPLSTIDPYVEVTVAPEATGSEGGNQLDTVAGLEWRPLARNTFIDNFRPWGLPLLEFVKNYRFVVEYYDRRNLKDEIANIDDFDFRFGIDIFYEWGIELNPVDREPRKGFVGWVENHVWGEYFGDYTWRDTNFTAEENFDAWILDTSLIVGLKFQLMKLPRNPVNERLEAMPYLRFGLIYNTQLANPADNRLFVAVGIRWMPFRDYRFANNEWLFKTKFFAEWLGIGKVQNFHVDDTRPHPDEDWRIGVAWSLRRF